MAFAAEDPTIGSKSFVETHRVISACSQMDHVKHVGKRLADPQHVRGSNDPIEKLEKFPERLNLQKSWYSQVNCTGSEERVEIKKIKREKRDDVKFELQLSHVVLAGKLTIVYPEAFVKVHDAMLDEQ